MSIHSDIKKFWEDAGYYISSIRIWDKNRDDIKGWHRYAPPDFIKNKIIARHFDIDGKLEIQYFLDPSDGNKYTEEEMLRLIKLKGFL